MTKNCESYKRFLEEKATEGLLDEYIEKALGNRGAIMELEYDQSPRWVNQMIHSLAPSYTRKEVRILRRQAEHDSHVMKLDKKWVRPDVGPEDAIDFTNEDSKGVQLPHNDVLVFTLHVGDYDVEKILVDQGSCTLKYCTTKNSNRWS